MHDMHALTSLTIWPDQPYRPGHDMMSCPGLYGCCMHTGVAHHVLCRTAKSTETR